MKISVVIPLFNKENTILRAISSVLNQTFQNFEIVVVNDGSTDNSVIKVEGVNDSRIKLIHQSNQGVSVARNTGILNAQFDWIAFLDADDEWLPEFLSKIETLHENHSDCSILATCYNFYRGDLFYSKPQINNIKFGFNGVITNYFELAIESDPLFNCSCVCVLKEALIKVNGFPSNVKVGEDFLTWTKLIIRYKLAYSFNFLVNIYEIFEGNKKSIERNNDNDIVGIELIKNIELLQNKHKIYYLKYIARWFKSRASIYLEIGKTRNCRQELIKAWEYSYEKKILIVFFCISLFPPFISKSLYSLFRKLYKKIK